MNKGIPIILQYTEKSSIQNLGGMAVYQNEFIKALAEVGPEFEVSSHINSGNSLFNKYHSRSGETCWRIFLGALRRISESRFSIFGSFFYGLIQKYLTSIFSQNKPSKSTVIYHHMNNFVFPEFTLIRIARKYNVCLITTIVDLLEVDFPEYLPTSTVVFRKHLKKFFKLSTSYFIPITNFIKLDALDSGLISKESKCQIIEWGTDHFIPISSTTNLDCASPKELNGSKTLKPFFLFPAKAWAHKGHIEFLEAYGANDGADFKVVFIGDLEPLREEMEKLVSQLGSKGRSNLNIIGFVDDESREQLMHDCRAVILPSCYEGFGFPYFEATFLKKAVVSFQTKSYAEFFGESANSITVLNQDFASFVQALIDFDDQLALEETERKLARIQSLTWNSCLKKTLHFYREILREIS